MAIPRYEIQYDMSNHYRFQLKSSSGVVLLTSGWFDNKQWASLAIQNAQRSSKTLSNYHLGITPDNYYYFDLPLMNKYIVATSQRYLSDDLRDAALMATIGMGSTHEIINTRADNQRAPRETDKTKF